MKRLAVAGVLALAAVLAAPLAAHADPVPPSGVIEVDDAKWQLDEYGIMWGWDAANSYDANGYIYYPGWFEDGPGYAYCPDPILLATMTVQDNGDVVIDCAEDAYPGESEVAVRFRLRLFAGAVSGHLARTVVTVTNTSDADFPLTGLHARWYPLGMDVAVLDFVTSSGETLAPAPTDSWFITGSPTGESVSWTSAWAKTGTTAASGLVVDGNSDDFWADYSAITVPAGGSVRLVHFTNMVIPTAKTEEAATAARMIAQSQIAEFEAFSTCRLAAGLDPALEYVGWGAPVPCAPASPSLPATGPADHAVAGPALVAALLLGVGVVLAVRRRIHVRAQ